MNRLSIPVTILVIIVLAIGAWYFFAQRSMPTTAPAQTTSTTVPQTQSATIAPALDESQVAANVVGTWQSTDDANYSVIITSSGKWTDAYKGSDASSSVDETGTYVLFTSQNPDKDFTGILVPGVVYVKVSEGSSVLYFSVLEANGTDLQLSYLDRGNTLSFTKVQ